MTDLLNRVGRSAFNYLSAGGGGGPENDFIGSIVDVDGTQIQVYKLLGEGGFAYIYAAKDVATGKEFALKRFLVFEEQKVNEVIAEIRLLKELKSCPEVVNYVTAASVDHGPAQGKKVNKEFLLLMELCPGGDIAKLMQRTTQPLSPKNVCIVMSSMCRALAQLHSRSPPVIHRDVKLENLLINCDSCIKLCDFGSITTKQHFPNQDWTMNQRSLLEDELAKYSTPMYRAPEMLDTWSNFPVTEKVDIWAAGCVLFALCFNKHPFEDSNKLAIVNGNYRIPAADARYKMFHNLIKEMLYLDPTTRPSAYQVLEQLSAISETHAFSTKGSLTDIPAPVQSAATASSASLNLGKAAASLLPMGRGVGTTPSSTSLPTSPSTSSLPNANANNFNNNNCSSNSSGRATSTSIPTTPSDPSLNRVPGAGLNVGGNIKALQGAAGSLFSRIKESTKTVVASVQSTMSSRELDFDCITSRVAAMSFPSEGIEATYRNHIEDVKNLMESQHSGYYTIYNLAERAYHPSKFPNGKVVHQPTCIYSSNGPVLNHQTLDGLLDLCSNILDYLSRDVRNVVVIHCLDGKSATAWVICGLLIYARLVTSPGDAVAVFTGKRCNPVLTASQMSYLSHLCSLCESRPPVLKMPFLSVNTVVLEPIPLFNRAADGCRPYVEVYQGDKLVFTSLVDYNKLTGYCVRTGDESATIRLDSVAVCGDVMVVVYHARQVRQISAAGGKTTTGIRMCSVAFHTSSLTPGRPTNQWTLAQLDGVSAGSGSSGQTATDGEGEYSPQHHPAFRLILNGMTSEECSGRNLPDGFWPTPAATQLLFNSEQDYEETVRLIPGGRANTRAPVDGSPIMMKKRTPEVVRKPAEAPSSVRPEEKTRQVQSGTADLLGLGGAGSGSGLGGGLEAQPKPQVGESPTADLLGGFGSPVDQPSSGSGESLNKPPSSASNLDFLIGAGGAGPSEAEAKAQNGTKQPTTSSSLDNFLSSEPATSGSDLLLNLTPSSNSNLLNGRPPQQQPAAAKAAADPFADFAGLGSALPPAAGAPKQPAQDTSSSNLLGDFNNLLGGLGGGGNGPTGGTGFGLGSASNARIPMNAMGAGGADNRAHTPTGGAAFGAGFTANFNQPPRPTGFAGPGTGGGMAGGAFSAGAQPASRHAVPPAAAAAAAAPGPEPINRMGPNYSRSLFEESGGTSGGVKPKVAHSAFDDLLGGFNPSSRESQNKTIGQMKKAEAAKALDPEEKKIVDWTEGKERNIRTLLSSLHKIVWEDSKWQECNMSQLVTPGDVKKMYRKACLAVHPDKQMNTPNERLSKLIFMELNEAWSEFDNDPRQQNLFK